MKLPSDKTKEGINILRSNGRTDCIPELEKQLANQLAEESLLREYGTDLEQYYADSTFQKLIKQNATLFRLKNETNDIQYKDFFNTCILLAIEYNNCFIKLYKDKLYCGSAVFGRCVGDICNRCYGAIIVNPNSFTTYIRRISSKVISGSGKVRGIDNLESNGKQLTAKYITETLSEEFPRYWDCMQNFNENIHLSWIASYYNDLHRDEQFFKGTDLSNTESIESMAYASLTDLEYVNEVLYKVLLEYREKYKFFLRIHKPYQ